MHINSISTPDLPFELREWQSDDAPLLCKNINNIRIWNMLRDALPYPYTLTDAHEFIEHTRTKTYLQDFAIVIDGEAVGGIGFGPLSDIERYSAELGYWLSEYYWGQGIMGDAIRVTSDHIFANTEIVRLFAVVFENNTGSMRALLKAGFREIGTLHKAAYKNGQFLDMHYLELVK